MRRRRGIPKNILPLVLGILMIGGLVWVIAGFFSGERQAKDVVQQFYTYEQEGAFAESWELFHTEMKAKFPKGHYLQDRAHVFMNHFGVQTFSFTMDSAEKLDSWSIEKGAKPLKHVYKITVIQTYKGKYGNFDLQQDVFAVKEKGEWKVLWSYQK
ncbi:hypothetical protein [Priestia abyssalis]|uniref:hypothetical protein n=1 Tax=Priestia abyssalis TaxID=1221450 RepID=UPI0009958910|nr:hypothetical protein [Priestia abyssalis]